ncbi:MAG: hypothetical protein L0191_09985 [Acidobacteria bacterium]|nr:hypothetical protein [Acidobacteriota bacterium]
MRPPTRRRLAAVIYTTLAGGGLLHLFVHSVAGAHDWVAVVAILVGARLAFNEEATNLLRAWRGTGDLGQHPTVKP